jgi:ABC-type nitrate/sulfonate/bicarbonate transport system permease component
MGRDRTRRQGPRLSSLAARLRLARTPRVSRRTMFWVLRVGSLAAALAAWQWYGDQPNQYAVAPPSEVLPALWDDLASGELIDAAIGTFSFMVVGFAIAAVLGLALGLAIAASDVADNTITPIVNAAYASPITLMIPIVGVYTGIEFWGKVFIVVAFTVFVILINTEAGVRAVPRTMIETARSFSVTRTQMIRHVIAPATTPYVLTGLRLGVGRAFRGAIVADLLLSVDNLGAVLVNAGSTFNIPRLIAGILFTTIVGLLLMTLVNALDRRVSRWRPTALQD